MSGRIVIAGLCLGALALAGCEREHMRGNHALCYDFRATAASSAPASSTAAEAAAASTSSPIDDCLRRWAYSLAPSRDPGETVANAVVAACTGALARWNEQTLSQGSTAVQAPSITTGQETNPMAEHNELAHGRALLYVVEARAGRCAPPPAANGAPQGVSG